MQLITISKLLNAKNVSKVVVSLRLKILKSTRFIRNLMPNSIFWFKIDSFLIVQ